jgi:hypothetical protein
VTIVTRREIGQKKAREVKYNWRRVGIEEEKKKLRNCLGIKRSKEKYLEGKRKCSRSGKTFFETSRRGSTNPLRSGGYGPWAHRGESMGSRGKLKAEQARG